MNNENERNKWVIVLFIYADFRAPGALLMNKKMKLEINYLLADIINSPIDDQKMRLYLIINNIKYNVSSEDNKLEVSDKTLLYTIKNAGLSYNKIDCCKIIEENTAAVGMALPGNLQKDDKLGNILNKIEVKNDEEVFLITWDHGSGFGIFEEARPTIPTEIKQFSEDLADYPYLKLFWDAAMFDDTIHACAQRSSAERFFSINNSIFKFQNDSYPIHGMLLDAISAVSTFAYDFRQEADGDAEIHINLEDYANTELNNAIQKKYRISEDIAHIVFDRQVVIKVTKTAESEILWNDELATALETWLKERKVSVLLMMNCDMMSIHTMYSLKDVVDFLVAPQGIISIPGYNYAGILSYISNTPPHILSPETLAKYCVNSCEDQSFVEKIKSMPSQDDSTIHDWVIIAVHLSARNVVSDETIFDQSLAKLGPILDGLIAMLTKDANGITAKNFYKFSRQISIDYTGTGRLFFIDLPSWIRLLSYYGLDLLPEELCKQLTGFNKFLVSSKIVVERYIGKNVLASEFTANLIPTGFGVLFPFENFNTDDTRRSTLILKLLQKDKFITTPLTPGKLDWKTFIEQLYAPGFKLNIPI